MPMVGCRRCGGRGQYSDQNPTIPNRFDWCAGCKGDGMVNIPDPNALCHRCGGRGIFNDLNPTISNRLDWCCGCQGSGYAT